MDKSEIIILVTGSSNHPWDLNYKECQNTWIPLIQKLGYNVKIALGDINIDNYFIDNGDIIKFKTQDSKIGLVDKSVILPLKWIINETNYKYYFRIDSDSFVHPIRFNNMLNDIIDKYNPDYLGNCTPYPGFNPNDILTTYIENKDHFSHYASGTAYMISRNIMQIVIDNIRIDNQWELECDDYVLGRTLYENNIKLLHTSYICMESKWKQIVQNNYNIKIPQIELKDSHLAIQHYQNGHMMEILLNLLS